MGGRGASFTRKGESGKQRSQRGKRGQLEAYKGQATAIKMLESETGFNHKDAQDAYNSLEKYFGGHYGGPNFTNEDLGKIDNALSLMGVYDGEIYRGVSLNITQLDALKVGEIAQVASEKGFVSSWSSRLGVAKSFSFGQNSVIFICNNNKSAVGVQHLSVFGDGEAEVLAPTTAKYKVTKLFEGSGPNSGYTFVNVEEVGTDE